MAWEQQLAACGEQQLPDGEPASGCSVQAATQPPLAPPNNSPSRAWQDAAPTSSGRGEPRFSLLSGGCTGGGGSGSDSEGEAEGSGGDDGDHSSTALALHAQQALVVSAAPGGRSDLVEVKSAADYLLHKRSWQGVETPLVGAAPAAVEAAAEGRSGRAATYVDEGQAAEAAVAQQQQQQD